MSKLILARHGATPYNELGLWTGLTDIDMSESGYREVEQGAEILADYSIHVAFSSVLQRARNTAQIILAHQEDKGIPLLETALLNEKDYGNFTGKSKQSVKSEVGEETFIKIRRSWDYPIENGESLEDVHARVVVLHQAVIIPILENNRNVLVSAHNNTLRAYVKEIERVPSQSAHEIELGTAEIRIYNFSEDKFVKEAVHSIGSVH